MKNVIRKDSRKRSESSSDRKNKLFKCAVKKIIKKFLFTEINGRCKIVK